MVSKFVLRLSERVWRVTLYSSTFVYVTDWRRFKLELGLYRIDGDDIERMGYFMLCFLVVQWQMILESTPTDLF